MTAMTSVSSDPLSGAAGGKDRDREGHRRADDSDAPPDKRDPEPSGEGGWRYGEFGPGWREFTEALERFRSRPRS